MTNKKHARRYYRKNLGRFHLTRNDILVIEKILKEYAVVYDDKMLARFPDSESKKRISQRTRKFADVHVKVGRWKSKLPKFYRVKGFAWGISTDKSGVEYIYDADSIKFLPKRFRVTRYFLVTSQPGISLYVSPLKCVIGAQRQYASGVELRAMDKAIFDIEDYLSSCKKSLTNRVVIR